MIIKNGVVEWEPNHNEREIVIPEGVNGIGEGAFSLRNQLQSISLPHSLKWIGKGAFHECSSLKSIIIPEGVMQIGEAAFLKCSSLQDVSIPHSVTTIGEGAFCRCDSLESITIPDSVNEVPRTIVLSCIHLQHFYYGDAVIDVNDSYYMDETIDRDVHAANEMVHTHNYSIDLPDCIKYPTILAYRKKQPDDLLTAYICMNAAQIITYLMQKDDVGEINSLLQTEKIIRDYQVMRHSLDLAIQHTQNGGSPDIQMLLMRYANSHFPAETRRFFL